MKYAPIVLFTYNRPVHTEKTLLSLTKNPEFKDSILYIYSDAAKDESSKEKVEEVRNLIHVFSMKNQCMNVRIIKAERNKGLAKSIIDGVTEVISLHGKVIVLEDDCVVSEHFLNFMNNCLNYYENNDKIGSISGFCPPIEIPYGYKSNILIVPRTSSLGWGTWMNRWNKVDWSNPEYKKIATNIKLIRDFNRCGSDRFYRLCRQMKFDIQSWSIRFGVNQFFQSYSTVYPISSYVKHIGNDGTGVHSTCTNMLDVDLDKAIAHPKLSNVEIDNRIQRRFYLFYSGSIIHRMVTRIKIIPYILKEYII